MPDQFEQLRQSLYRSERYTPEEIQQMEKTMKQLEDLHAKFLAEECFGNLDEESSKETEADKRLQDAINARARIQALLHEHQTKEGSR